MTITRVGTNEKYANGWESIFGGKKSRSAKATPAAATSARSASKPKAVKKAAKASSSKPAAKKISKKPNAKKVVKKSR